MLNDIENIVIFMADDLRWDYTPESLLKRGIAFKTVSAGTTTYMSTVSMLTGTHPQSHGIFSWNHVMPNNLTSLLELKNFNTGFYNAAGENDGLNSVLRQDEQKKIEDLEPPFIYFERDHGSHIPYRGIGYKGTIEDFYREYGCDKDKIQNKYKESIEASILRFNKRINLLEERGLLSKTLVIFTSDHGELLGEHGLVDHTAPLVPELVYVPTIFVHEELEPKLYLDRIMRHVDLLPTILKILDKSLPDHCEGENIFSEKITMGPTYSIKPLYLGNRVFYSYEASSAWDQNGGHVFNKSSILLKFASALALLFGKNWKSRYIRKNLGQYPSAIKNYLINYKKFGSPSISYKTAKEYTRRIDRGQKFTFEKTELNEEVKERLRDLGYL